MLVAAAGGIDLDGARSAVFNGADIVVANIVRPEDNWTGISTSNDITAMAKGFLSALR